MSRRVLGVLLAVVVALVTAGCGGGESGRFDDEVGAVREAVDEGDRAAALAALDELEADAAAAREQGVLGDATFVEVHRSLDTSRTLVDQLFPTTTATTTVAPTTSTSPTESGEDDEKDEKDEEDEEPEKEDDDSGPGEGRGNGRGLGHDD